MMFRCLIVIAGLALFGVAGCSTGSAGLTKGEAEIHQSLTEVKKWTDSLAGLSIDEGKKQFPSAKPKESTWSGTGESGTRLTYDFKKYEIEIFFSNDRVALVSIDLFPE